MTQRGFKVTLHVTWCDNCPWSHYDHDTDLSCCTQADPPHRIQVYNENCNGVTDSCPVAHIHEEFEYVAF